MPIDIAQLGRQVDTLIRFRRSIAANNRPPVRHCAETFKIADDVLRQRAKVSELVTEHGLS